MDAGLKSELEAKVNAGERLTREDGIALYESDDLAWLGRLAHQQRTKIGGDRVTFAVNRETNTEDGASVTMVYGGTESLGDRVDEILRVRDVQDQTGGFAAFIPLRANADIAPAQSLKTFAVARLLLDNVDHLRSSWESHGAPVTQLSLNFGADDIEAPGDVDREEILTLVGDAGFRPVERDRQYAEVRAYDAPPSYADRRSQPQQVWA